MVFLNVLCQTMAHSFHHKNFTSFRKSTILSTKQVAQTTHKLMVKLRTVKSLLNKNVDPHLALLVYRSTPLENGYSPAELLMSRKLRTTIPVISDNLQPKLPNNSELRQKEEKMRQRQKKNFDSRHRAQTLDTLLPGETVWLPDQRTEGTVVRDSAPRSYTVQTSKGQYRRNRRHIIFLPTEPITNQPDTNARRNPQTNSNDSPTGSPIPLPSPPSEPNTSGILTKSGRRSKPPD